MPELLVKVACRMWRRGEEGGGEGKTQTGRNHMARFVTKEVQHMFTTSHSTIF